MRLRRVPARRDRRESRAGARRGTEAERIAGRPERWEDNSRGSARCRGETDGEEVATELGGLLGAFPSRLTRRSNRVGRSPIRGECSRNRYPPRWRYPGLGVRAGKRLPVGRALAKKAGRRDKGRRDLLGHAWVRAITERKHRKLATGLIVRNRVRRRLGPIGKVENDSGPRSGPGPPSVDLEAAGCEAERSRAERF